jgi:hypothetical protein
MLSHFGNRAIVIKTAGAVNRSRAACRQAIRVLPNDKIQAVEAASARLEEFEVREEDVTDLALLRQLYRDENRLNLEPHEVEELRRVTGEAGPSCAHRLGLEAQGCPAQMLEIASERVQYWRRRAGAFGLPSDTAHAARTVTRCYERIINHVREAERHLEFET